MERFFKDKDERESEDILKGIAGILQEANERNIVAGIPYFLVESIDKAKELSKESNWKLPIDGFEKEYLNT